jgi:hypothetical protein
MSVGGRGERPVCIGAFASTTAPLHSIPGFCTVLPAHLPLGRGAHKVFCPLCCWDARWASSLRNRDLNAVDANANGGERGRE